jgi:hypothetical protein
MPEPFNLEKTIWTDADFEMMGWHDAPVYAMAVFSKTSISTTEIVFDIDYIFKWIDPLPPSPYFSFWTAPCTLTFSDVAELSMEIDSIGVSSADFEIADIYRHEQITYRNGQSAWKWSIELLNGEISFSASGFKQIVKQLPVLRRVFH